MSDRELVLRVVKTEPGEVRELSLFRDNETQTYRLFVERRWIGGRLDDCACIDVTVEELAEWSEKVAALCRCHEPWIVYDHEH